MKPFISLTRLFSNLSAFAGLKRNIAASLYGQGVSIFGQILLVPVLIYAWGQNGFGQWVLISAVPALLAYSDFGFGVIAGNVIGAADANKNQAMVFRAFVAGKLFTTVAALIAGLLLIGLSVASSYLNSADIFTAELTASIALAIASMISLNVGFYTAVLRGLGLWSKATITNNNLRLVEIVLIAICALLSDYMWIAATAMLVTRAANLYLLRRCTADLIKNSRITMIDWKLLKSWINPSLTYSLLPISQGLVLNLPMIYIGRVSGVAAVAEFAAIRTLTRVALQVSNVFGTAIAGPALRESAVVGPAAVSSKILSASLLTTIASGLVGLALLLAYPLIFRLWTHGEISPNGWLVASMTLCALCSSAWTLPSNFLSAINRHGRIYLAYFSIVILAICSVAFTKPTMFGISVILLVVELCIAVLCIVQLKSLKND